MNDEDLVSQMAAIDELLLGNRVLLLGNHVPLLGNRVLLLGNRVLLLGNRVLLLGNKAVIRMMTRTCKSMHTSSSLSI